MVNFHDCSMGTWKEGAFSIIKIECVIYISIYSMCKYLYMYTYTHMHLTMPVRSAPPGIYFSTLLYESYAYYLGSSSFWPFYLLWELYLQHYVSFLFGLCFLARIPSCLIFKLLLYFCLYFPWMHWLDFNLFLSLF